MSRPLSMTSLGVALALGVCACNGVKPEKPSPESVKGVAAEGSVQDPGHLGHPTDLTAVSKLSEEDRKQVLATLGDVQITLGELEDRLNEQPSYVRIRYNAIEKKKEFLDNLVEFELLALEARSKGYDKDPDVVFAMKQSMIKKLVKEDIADLVKLSDISEDAMRAWYDQNPELYHKPEQVRASAVLLADKAAGEQVVAQLTKALEDNPRRKRQTFNDFIKNRSVASPSGTQNGDLGFVTREGTREEGEGTIPAPVAEAAFALQKINDVSGVIEADGKAWVLMLTNRRPKVEKSFDEVKRQIQNKLFRDEKETARERYLADLRAKAKVVVHEEKLALIKNPEVQGQVPGMGLPVGRGPGPDSPEGMQRQIEQLREKAKEKAGDEHGH